jgi:periplasmic copper chaperone A
MRRYLALAAALAFASPMFAHEVLVGDLHFIHPNIPQPAPGAQTASGYMAMVNLGTEADRLIGVETAFAAKAVVHSSQVDAAGTSSMRPMEGLEVPAGTTISLEPGGQHIMFMGLGTALTEGDMVAVTLIFEMAGRVEVEFMIDPPIGSAPTDHSAHTVTD